jgi:hypothetical protein
MFFYVVVCGTSGKHTSSCTKSLHHIALHIIRGCCRLFSATVPIQHRTLPEEGYDAASYLVGCGGSGHGICIAFALIVGFYILVMHIGTDVVIRAWSSEVNKRLKFILLFI